MKKAIRKTGKTTRHQVKKRAQARQVAASVFDTKALTKAQIAVGKLHTPVEIKGVKAQMVAIPLRAHRDRAFIVECLCAFCDRRRTLYLRS
jgi:hypothetical protein